MSNILGKSVADIIVDDNEFAEEPLIAPGLHPAIITSISEGTSQAGDDFCKIHFEITGGQNAGVKVADFLGWTTDVRAQISDKKLKSLLTICGVKGALQSYDELCMKPLQINNKIYSGKDGTTRNSINYYRGPAQYAAQPQVAAPAQNIPQPTWGQQPPPAPAPQPAMPQMPQQPMQPQVPVQQPPPPQQQVHPQYAPQQQQMPQQTMQAQPQPQQTVVQHQMPPQNFNPDEVVDEQLPW